MDEASQNSFYDDDLLVSGVTSEVKNLLKNEKLFTCRSADHQLQELPIPNELRTDDAPDFAVPDCDDQKCQLEIQQDITHTTSMSHFLPQEHRAVPSIEMCNEISSMANNLKEPTEEHMHSKDDTGKYGASQDDLYLDWNVQSQSKSELMNKVPSTWPAIGVKSVVTDNDKVTPDQPTLSFFTLAKQARVLSDEQLQKIMEIEHSHHSEQHPRSPLKRNSPSQETFGSPAEKFAKIDLDTEMENCSENHELFSPDETIDDCNGVLRVDSDQEVPFREEGGNVAVEAVVDEQMHDNAISSASSFGKTPSLNSENSILNGHGSNDGHFYIGKAPFHEEPHFTGPCTESFCAKFTKKDHGGDLSKIQEKESLSAYEEDAASSSDAKNQGDEPFLANQLGEISEHPEEQQTVKITNEEISVHGEVHVVPNPLPVIDNIPYKYPPLAQMAPYDTSMCSSLRAIDERDLITECLDDVDCSPIKSIKDLTKAETPSLYQQEEVHDWDRFLPKTSQDLESFSKSCSTTILDDMVSWHAECFEKVQMSKSTKKRINEQPAPLTPEETPNTNDIACLPSESIVDAFIDVTADMNNCHQQAACEETILEAEGISNEEGMKIPTNVSDQENDNKTTMALGENAHMVLNITTPDDTGSSTGNDDDDNKENGREFTYQENNLETSPGTKEEKKTSDGHQEETDQFRTEIESKMIDLDGPELLQFAMIFVEGALKKSKTVPGCSEQLKCDEESKNVTRAAPVFPWKRRILYQSQQASLLGSTYDETYPIEAGSYVDEDGRNGDTDNQEGSSHIVMPLPKTSWSRPLRLGLSRKHRNKPLHPYLKKHSNAKPN